MDQHDALESCDRPATEHDRTRHALQSLLAASPCGNDVRLLILGMQNSTGLTVKDEEYVQRLDEARALAASVLQETAEEQPTIPEDGD